MYAKKGEALTRICFRLAISVKEKKMMRDEGEQEDEAAKEKKMTRKQLLRLMIELAISTNRKNPIQKPNN